MVWDMHARENLLLSMLSVLSDREGRKKRCLTLIEKIALFGQIWHSETDKVLLLLFLSVNLKPSRKLVYLN